MGNLHQRGKIWYADFYDRSGKRKQRSTKTTDIKVARARLRDFELATTTHRTTHPTEALDAALAYFVDVTCASKPAGTVRCYRQKARHLSRLLGSIQVDQLGREDIERYIANRLGEGAHPHSVHKEMVVLRGALNASEKRDRFHAGIGIVPKVAANYEPRVTYLTPDQFMSLTEHLAGPVPPKATDETRAEIEKRRARRTLYCLLIALASPRRGELEKLDWTHVDFHRGVIRVPKGKTKGRDVPIHPVLRPWLEAYDQGSGLIIEPWGNVGRDLPAACRRAGVPRCTPNDLRRTFASWLKQAGEDSAVVAEMMGHKSTRMVDLVYGKIDEATRRRAIERLPGGSHAGYTHAVHSGGTTGTPCHSATSDAAADSVEESANSASCVVPRVGIEPTTRGFSVPISPVAISDEKRRPRLRLVG
jgi:integrase